MVSVMVQNVGYFQLLFGDVKFQLFGRCVVIVLSMNGSSISVVMCMWNFVSSVRLFVSLINVVRYVSQFGRLIDVKNCVVLGSVKMNIFCVMCVRQSMLSVMCNSVVVKLFRWVVFMMDFFVSGWEWIVFYLN